VPKHKLQKVLLNQMNLFPVGNKTFIEKNKNWNLEINAKWNSRRINLSITSKKLNFNKEFIPFSIKKAPFLSFIARYNNYKFYGKSSRVSDLFLESPFAQNLLISRKANIELNHKNWIYKGQIRRKDKTSLSNIFILIERLNEQIDLLIDKRVT